MNVPLKRLSLWTMAFTLCVLSGGCMFGRGGNSYEGDGGPGIEIHRTYNDYRP